MSFSRFADGSDVYTFPCVSGHYECCACPLDDDGGSFRTPDVETFLAHLDAHTAAGHDVPDHTRAAVREWAAEYGDSDLWGADRHTVDSVPSFGRRYAYQAVVRFNGRVVTRCRHNHGSHAHALACARIHLIPAITTRPDVPDSMKEDRP